MLPFDLENPEHKKLVKPGTILMAYRGSIAHNMFLPKNDPKSVDDVDLIGVVIPSIKNYFGLSEWAHRGTREYKEDFWDMVFYEVRKMFNLLVAGNPNVISLLWLRPEHYVYLKPEAQMILDKRHLFDGKHIFNAFAGYAHQQLVKMERRDPEDLRMYLALTYEAKVRGIHPNHKGEKFKYPDGYDFEHGEALTCAAMKDDGLLQKLAAYMKKGDNIGYLGDKRKHLVLEHGYDAKNASHCVRLLKMASEYFETGTMTVYRDKDREELLDIKRGKWKLEEIKTYAEELFAGMRIARDKSSLPDEPDVKKIESLLVDILKLHFTIKGL